MKKQKFFFGKVAGLNADIERHRVMERDLRASLAKYEQEGKESLIATYRHFLNQLLQSKADVVSRIGKKK